MEKQILDIRIQMEQLITERESMIALNKERETAGNAIAYDEQAFINLAEAFIDLRKFLKKIT